MQPFIVFAATAFRLYYFSSRFISETTGVPSAFSKGASPPLFPFLQNI